MGDAKREEFRKYLEKEGVLEFLTKQLVKIYEEEEKPKNALEYLKNNFAGNDSAVNGLKIENLEKEKENLEKEKENLEKENLQLKETIKTLQHEKENLEKENFQLKETNTQNSMGEYVVPPVSNDVPEKDVENVIANEDEPMETEKVEDISEKAETVSDDVEEVDNTPSQPEDVPEKAETVSEDVEGIDNSPTDYHVGF